MMDEEDTVCVRAGWENGAWPALRTGWAAVRDGIGAWGPVGLDTGVEED